MFAAFGTEYGEAFAAQAMSKQKSLGHIVFGCRCCQVDGFRYSTVAVLLKGGLDMYVVGRRDVMGGYEKASNIPWDAAQVLDRWACDEIR